jgi:small subunit ribosomal protein S8
MSMTDPIADMLTRIRNAQQAKKYEVAIPSSTKKLAVLKVLRDEGYISDFRADATQVHPQIVVKLKYYQGSPVIERLERVSKPGCRVFRGADELPKIDGGLGISIVSTSKGVMSDRAARKLGQGGEVICIVS